MYQPATLATYLGEVISLAGLRIQTTPSEKQHESRWGIKTENRSGQTFVATVFPGSPAAVAGILKDDELIFVESIRIENNLSELLAMNTRKIFR